MGVREGVDVRLTCVGDAVSDTGVGVPVLVAVREAGTLQLPLTATLSPQPAGLY